jgi:hypothetical protein
VFEGRVPVGKMRPGVVSGKGAAFWRASRGEAVVKERVEARARRAVSFIIAGVRGDVASVEMRWSFENRCWGISIASYIRSVTWSYFSTPD